MNNEIDSLRQELETERLRLAACGVAALGYFEGCKDKYKSASLDDVLRLYASYEKVLKDKNALQARIDELMLEFCPEEMTEEQIEEWAKHQKVYNGNE